MGLEHAVAAAASELGVSTHPGIPVPWLTVRGHLDLFVQRHASPDALSTLEHIHRILGGDSTALATKRQGRIAPDLTTPDGQLIEIDELQHFSSARGRTLETYPPTLTLGFSRAHYTELIHRWRSRADRSFAHKSTADFAWPGGRTAQRAYNDALRDVLAPEFTGLPVIRVAAPDRDVRVAAAALASHLGGRE